MKIVLIIGYGSSKRRGIFEHIRLIRKELQIERLICLHEKVANWLEQDKLIDDWILVPQFQQQPLFCIKQIEAYHKTNSLQQFDAILTFDEDCVLLCNFLCLHFGNIATCKTQELIYQIKDKYLFRSKCIQWKQQQNYDDKMQHILLSQYDIGYVPFFETVPNILASNISTLPYCKGGYILKPRIGAGKIAVQKFATKQDLHHFLLSKQLCWENYMIEEFFEGNEVDIDCLVQNKTIRFISISDNNATLQDPYLQETGGNIPSILPFFAQQQLKQMTTQLISLMEIENGCLHFEAKYHDNICMPIEINLRLGGAETFAMVYHCHHVDLVKYALQIALGSVNIDTHSLVCYDGMPSKKLLLLSYNFHSTQSGQIMKLENEIILEQETRVKELILFKSVGDSFQIPPLGFDSCYGWIVVSSKEFYTDKDETKRQQIMFETKSYLQMLCSKIRLEYRDV